MLHNKYVMNKYVGKISVYNVYEGVDLDVKEPIVAYIKLVHIPSTIEQNDRLQKWL